MAATVRAHPWSSALVALATIALAWRLLIAYVLPPYTWDGLAYHLTAVAGWLQDERIGANQLHIAASTFPMNGELVGAWLALFHKTDTWIDAFQMPFAIIGALAVAGLARLAGRRIARWRPAACSSWSDRPGAGDRVRRPVRRGPLPRRPVPAAPGMPTGRPRSWSVAYLVLAGCAAGLAAGGPTRPLLSSRCSSVRGGRAISRPGAAGAHLTPAIFVPVLALGAWYARDAVEHSNFVYPARVDLAGETIPRGPGVTQTAPPGTISSARPSCVRGRTTSSGSSTVRRVAIVEYGEVEGGMGLVWLLLGCRCWPSSSCNSRGGAALIWTFLVPLGACRSPAISPVSRFTIVLLAAGLVALVVVLETIPSRLLRVTIQSLTLVLVAIAVWFSSGRVIQWGHVYSLSRRSAWLVAPGRADSGPALPAQLQMGRRRHQRPVPLPPVYINAQQCADCPDLPFFYGLYGRHFQHRVFRLRGSTRDSMLAWLRRHDIGYVTSPAGPASACWLAGVPAPVQGLLVAAYATAADGWLPAEEQRAGDEDERIRDQQPRLRQHLRTGG